jgi:hypothetical protein
MKRIFSTVVAAALLVLLLPLTATAYVPSPQYGAIEIKFGPYRPNVDDQPGITGTPYKDTYGKKESMFLATLEVDWQFFRIPVIEVSLGLAGSMGFMRESANALTVTGDRSNDETSINVFPFALLGVIRVDSLADLLGIPLIPYFKAGVNWYVWWTRTSGTTDGSGGTPGWQINPGLALRLDQFDKMSARTFDNEVGVNHSFIFFELLIANVDGFGGSDNLYLSPLNIGRYATWQAGLGVEF